MKHRYFLLLGTSLLILGCNNSNVNIPKSPFKDEYKRIGMKSEYTSTIESIGTEEFNDLKDSIKNYKDNDKNNKSYSYTRIEETRDLKAAYFGKNIGAANLCSLTTRKDTNNRYKNNVTTKFVTTHKENQVMNGTITKSDSVVNDYVYEYENNKYAINQLSKTDKEEEIIKIVSTGDFDRSKEEDLNHTFGLAPYSNDIKNNFGTIKIRNKELIFNVLADDNNAVYGKTKINNEDKIIIKEAKSLFNEYSTTVGDTYKVVNNFFYEALLNPITYKFTDFRFYTEMLVLTEAVSDDEKVPVLYLDKPQLVEFSEIKYQISYQQNGEFNKGDIPQPK